MSEIDTEDMKEHFKSHHHDPQHPLPEEIQKMDRDDTVCRYCGVSYLIHSEIKALERKVKSLEKELENFQGSEERENKLKEEIKQLQEQKGEFEMNITVKDAAIASLTTNLRNQESISERLRNEKDDMEKNCKDIEQSKKLLKERNNALEQNLTTLQFALKQQKFGLEDIHNFMDNRDKQMKEEMAILLSHVKTTCDKEIEEKRELQTKLSDLQSQWGQATTETEDMKNTLLKQEEQIKQLDKLFTENKSLQQRCEKLETSKSDLEKELETSIEKCRSLQMEVEQFKNHYKSKNSEIEELTAVQRRKEQAMEMTTQKLKSDLVKKENDLKGARRELTELQNKFELQQQKEEDLSRRAARNNTEAKDLKESFFRAKEEVEKLKEEREAMIMSHQNRIEQLRESFKEKLAEADSWQDKLEAAIQKEKERHARELQQLEDRLKESFVMELEIEKGKYRELMKKYQAESQGSEEKLRAQLASIESRYKAEISDLNELLAENRRKSKEIEDELRKEIASLKEIIKDLEARLARLDVGNEDLVMKLKHQLRETHNELEETRETLDKQKKATDHFQDQVKSLQETVQKECEERFELTEALSTAKEELLKFKKPIGQQNGGEEWQDIDDVLSETGGYASATPRQLTALSLHSEDGKLVGTASGNRSLRKTVSEPQPVMTNRPVTSRTYNSGGRQEYRITNHNNMVFANTSDSVQTVGGGAPPRQGGTLAENRRRIASILGRKR